jgi:DNA primase catalytic subunit
MSVLNWLFPDRVGEKQRAKHAYPISGEYLVDINANSVWRYHPSCNMHKKICLPCLRLAKEATIEVLEKNEENYSKINIVFSGHRGFHVHVWDFDLEDWTRYDVTNPVKSHEVARFLYTNHLIKGFGDFRQVALPCQFGYNEDNLRPVFPKRQVWSRMQINRNQKRFGNEKGSRYSQRIQSVKISL